MKTQRMLLASLAAFALSASRGAAADVSVSVFYDALEPHGEWIEVSDYGYVWTPRGVDADWRPYTDGQWAYTDAGWTWVSEEPYAWAVYHYGRWANIENVGWSWVPDTEWGPAWVSWRHSDRYVGWAPLPPESRETIRVGVNLGNWVDSYYDIGPTNYSFVEVRNLGAPRIRTVILPPRENITIITQTTNITNVVVRNNIVVNEGPNYDVIVRQTSQPIRRLKLERRTDIATDARSIQGDAFRSRIQGDTLAVPAPRFQAAAATTTVAPRKVARRVEAAVINHGWKDAGDAQKVETFRNKLQAEAKPPANLPPVKRRDRDETGGATANRPTARTGTEADTNTKPPGPGRDTKAPGESTRPPIGTARVPGEDASRPTADTSRPPADGNKPSAETRAPGRDNRPSAERRTPGAQERPAAATPDSTKPEAGPDATSSDRPAQPDRPGAERGKAGQRKQGDRRNDINEGPLPKRGSNPGDAANPPVNPPQPEDTTPPPASTDREQPRPGRRGTAGERPGAKADRPGAPDRKEADRQPDRPDADRPAARGDRPDAAPNRQPVPRSRPEAPDTEKRPNGDRPRAAGDRPDAAPDQQPGDRSRPETAGAPRPERNRAERGGPDGAGAGNPRPDRPEGARGPGAERPEGARGDGGNNRVKPDEAERGRPGPGAGSGPARGAAAPGGKPGKADGEKPENAKKEKDKE